MESGTRIEAETLVRKATAIIQMKNVDSLVQFSGRGGYDKYKFGRYFEESMFASDGEKYKEVNDDSRIFA